MVARAERNSADAHIHTDPDLGVLAGRLLFAVQNELFSTLAANGFADLHPRHGAVLAYIEAAGVRATELARLSGQHKQVIGTVIDELEALGYVERKPDPGDRRAKLVCPTERGLEQMRTAETIMTSIQERHARRLGHDTFTRFKEALIDVTEHQRRHQAR
ncbi:MarR family winged helix-turn-helix transcriptional regulator [Pseudonocardia alaniniphila]|uniref:MarR family transcriptional regulator n=1 Tax=Pseudonocardia alaniniphila TaxID=75291 RepID=A0ABS9TK54_9PSEU|nr:MarR family transcriptional regulator [Pseudonocardia alaniniphila]MCH6168920.1 MarR family transcriptional regulator [Pseudonocardia alaniniphila]